MKPILFVLSAVACLGLTAGACSKKDEKKDQAAAPKGAATTATTAPAEATPAPDPAAPAASDQSAPGDQTTSEDLGVADLGVPQCTEYVQKMSTCLDDPKFPEQTREAAKKTLQQAVQQWKQLPEKARVGLGPACATSLAKAKEAYEKVGCSF